MYACMYVRMHIYIYIYRERERERILLFWCYVSRRDGVDLRSTKTTPVCEAQSVDATCSVGLSPARYVGLSETNVTRFSRTHTWWAPLFSALSAPLQIYCFKTNRPVLRVLKLTPRQGTPMRVHKRPPEL